MELDSLSIKPQLTQIWTKTLVPIIDFLLLNYIFNYDLDIFTHINKTISFINNNWYLQRVSTRDLPAPDGSYSDSADAEVRTQRWEVTKHKFFVTVIK